MDPDLGVLPKPIPFGKYCLLEKVSVGGMAEVYKAKAFGVEGFERLLAVKKILNAIAEDETFISMFIDEAKIAGQLNHPNIAQIFDLGKVDGSYFIALEYVSGKDLRTLWDRMVRDNMKPDIFMACYIVMKVCEALHYAHTKHDAAGNELNIVHRDISPHNVLIAHEGECKIIDFGIAKAQGKSSQTQVGILKGKFSYMSPEQVRGLHIDHRADIFSLGIVLYELLTLQRLFLGESDFDTLEKIRKVEMSPPTLYNPHIPRELEDIVLKGLAKSPDDRFQTAAEFRDALERFMRNQSSFFDQKDMAAFMKTTFAADIELERKKLDYYRTINLESIRNGQSGMNGQLSWDEEEVETHIFHRRNTPPNPDEINPSAELGIAGYNDAAFSEPAFVSGQYDGPGNTPVADIVYKSGEYHSADLQEVDDEEDPTMEFDRVRVAHNLTPPISNGPPSGDVFDAAIEAAAAPPPLPATKPMSSLQGSNAFTATETMPPGMVIPEKPARSGRGAIGIILAMLMVIFLAVITGVAGLIFYPQIEALIAGEQEGAVVTFKISNADEARITIDGDVVHDGPTTDDVVLEGVESGERNIEITADGFATLRDSLSVRSGQTYVLPISLDEEAPEAREPGLSVKVTPDGVEVWIGDDKVDESPPFTRKDLEPGSYTLTFKKEGFLEETREVEVKPGETTEVDVALKPAVVDLTVRPEPNDAEVVVFEKDKPDTTERRKVKGGRGVMELKGLDARRFYDVEVNRRGYEPWSTTFVPSGEATKSLVASLTSTKEDKTLTDDERRRRDEERRKAREERLKRLTTNNDKPDPPDNNKEEKDPPTVVVKKDPEPTGYGVLNVSSKPAARVFIDGKDTKQYTPLLNYRLPAGRHSVLLRNDDQGLRKSYTIEIKAGGSKSILNLPKK